MSESYRDFDFASSCELANREGIATSHLARVLRLTLLAPQIVEAIPDRKQGPEVTLACVLEPLSTQWSKQLFERPSAHSREVESRLWN